MDRSNKTYSSLSVGEDGGWDAMSGLRGESGLEGLRALSKNAGIMHRFGYKELQTMQPCIIKSRRWCLNLSAREVSVYVRE